MLCWRQDWADTSLQCWQQNGGSKGNDAIMLRATMPMQQGQGCQRNSGNDDSTMPAMTPVRCGEDVSTKLVETPALHWPDHRRLITVE